MSTLERHRTSYLAFWRARERSSGQGATSPRLGFAPAPDSTSAARRTKKARGAPYEVGAPLLAIAIALVSCGDPSASQGSAQASAPPPATTTTAAAAPSGPRIEWMAAPDGDVAAIAKREAERAKREGRALLVYVGASWCEPCQRFHEAAEAGKITGDLPPLRMLELDLDRDAERLEAAGYGSKMIPLFAVPGPDGRGGDLRIEGSIKGSGAVSNIVPRLRALLARAGGS